MSIRKFLNFSFPFVAALSLFFFLTTLWAELNGSMSYIEYQLDLRFEKNIATWFQSMLFFIISLSFFTIANGARSRYNGNLYLFIFQFIAFVTFVFFSADEAGSIHEVLGKKFGEWVGWFRGSNLEGRCYSCWIILYIIPAAAFVLIFLHQLLKFRKSFNSKTMKKRLVAGFIVLALGVSLVIALEFLEGYIAYTTYSHATFAPVLEEGFELLSLCSLLYINKCVINELSF